MESNPSPLMLISHGGMQGDFFLLLTNCMKSDVDYVFLTTATFVDSVKAFKDSGYYKPGLDTLCRIDNITNVIRHSAKDDASILKQLCKTHQFIFERCKTASLNEVLEYVMWKLPIPILTLHIIAEYVATQHLMKIICRFVRDETALKPQHARKVALYYHRSWTHQRDNLNHMIL